MLTALIVDDEFPAREELAYLLTASGGVKVTAMCEDGEEALEFLRWQKADIIFLDIHMPAKDGLSVAKQIRSMADAPYVIFTTGYSEYAAMAFELDAIDYLVKPYAKDRLLMALRKVLQRQTKRESKVADRGADSTEPIVIKLPVWANGRMLMIKSSDIFFAQANGKRSTLLNTLKGIFPVSLTLRELESTLSAANFIRTHKSFLVNLERIEEIVPWFNNTYVVTLQDCPVKDIPVARHFMTEFNRRLRIKSSD